MKTKDFYKEVPDQVKSKRHKKIKCCNVTKGEHEFIVEKGKFTLGSEYVLCCKYCGKIANRFFVGDRSCVKCKKEKYCFNGYKCFECGG